MGTDREERTWLIQKNTPDSSAPFDSFMGSIVGPNTDPLSVVEESRLREVEAERDTAKRSSEGLLDAVERLNETNDRLRTEVEQLQTIAGTPLVDAEDAAREAEARAERLEAELEEARAELDRRDAQAARRASKGGKARSANLSPEARSEIARDAAKKRWERARGVLRKGDTGGG
jgi:DNA repair exonuclease SbcCD ATPase subunit